MLLNYLQKTSIIYIYLVCTLLYGCICASQIPINFSYVMEKVDHSVQNSKNSKILMMSLLMKKCIKEEDYTFSLLLSFLGKLKIILQKYSLEFE